MTDRLSGRTVVVTGASRGIGAAIVSQLAKRGAQLIRVARSPLPVLAGAHDFRGDLADADSRQLLLDRITAAHGLPDAIVSNAGAFMIAPLADTTDAQLREQLAINLEAPFAIARHFLPAMRDRGAGDHVLIGSVADTKAFSGNAAYAASKFGLRGLHEVLCEEFRGSGVRCTLVSPGATDTAAWDPIDPDRQEGFIPRARMLSPANVAEAVVQVLASPPHLHFDSIRLNPA